jgi:hypothetical protein
VTAKPPTPQAISAREWLTGVVPAFRVTPVAGYPVSEIGGWRHSDATVREVCGRPDFWEYADLSEDELTAAISPAGVTPEHCLHACAFLSGAVLLVDGCHRWAVASALGFATVPVEMTFEIEESR